MIRERYSVISNIKRWASQDSFKPVAIAALLVILVVGAARDARLLSQHNVPVGIDGYYYVLQVDALKKNHRLYFPSHTPLILYFLTGISYFTNNSVTAVKVGSVLLNTLLCMGIFALIENTTHNLWLGVLGSALATISGLHLYMIAEFINSLGALTLLVWSGWCVVRWAQTRGLKWIALALVLIAGAVFSHQMAVGVVLVVTVSLFLFNGLVSSKSEGRYAFAALIAFVAIYFAPAVFKAQAVIDIPERLRTELSAIPQWPISYNYFPETLVLVLCAPLTVLLLLEQRRRIRAGSVGSSLAGLVAIWSLLVTLNPFLTEDRGWTEMVGRIRGWAYIQVALILPAVIWLVFSTRRKFAFYILAIVPPFAILTALSPLPLGLRAEYLSRRAQLAQNLPYYTDQVSRDSLVIASHGDQFLVTARLGTASQRLAPENTTAQTVYWLLDTSKHQSPAFESVRVAEYPTSMTVLVEDRVLRLFLQSATDVDKRRLISYNRHLVIAYNRGGAGSPFR
jgi:dolichyl-phosphate-mannose-protein mannosyltransferase